MYPGSGKEGMPTLPLLATTKPRVVLLYSAYGLASSARRGASGVYAPVLAPGRTATSSQRACPSNAAAPKSRSAVNSPPLTGRSFLLAVPPICVAAAGRVEELELEVVGAVGRAAGVA